MKVVAVKIDETHSPRTITVYGGRPKNRKILLFTNIEGLAPGEVKAFVLGVIRPPLPNDKE